MKTSFPKEKIRVVLLEGVAAPAVRLFEGEGFTVESHAKSPTGAALARAVADAHIVGIRSRTRVTAEVLAGAPRLLALGCFCIGTNQVDLADACARGVPAFNAPFSNTRSVAELTIAEIVALLRRLTEKSERLHAGKWEKSAAGAREVRGRTLGIVGYGRIGSQVSVLAEALGMRVIYHDVAARLPLGNARCCRTLDELLAGADVVTLHVPETAATQRMVAGPQLARMKPGSFLINNARGSVVDVSALAAAIRDGRLGGAAIDVFPEEPTGADQPFTSELRGLPNVILTPHIAGSTEEAQDAIAEDVASKLTRFINNGTTAGAVNVPEVDLPEQGDRTAADGAAGAPADSRRRHRILHFHRNVPGVLSKVHAVIAGLGVNINAEYLRTNAEVGYVVLDVDPSHGDKVLAGLRAVPETIRVRILW
ncbi:MAG: phosphoglycerate dehydrogenase [Phycisphaerales bacterium]